VLRIQLLKKQNHGSRISRSRLPLAELLRNRARLMGA
jgi:hypothetical protein